MERDVFELMGGGGLPEQWGMCKTAELVVRTRAVFICIRYVAAVCDRVRAVAVSAEEWLLCVHMRSGDYSQVWCRATRGSPGAW